MGDNKNEQRKQMPTTWRGKGGDEDRECQQRTASRQFWENWEENGEQQQQDRRRWRLLVNKAEKKKSVERKENKENIFLLYSLTPPLPH